ncbi:MAG TPA: GDSL family lipase [Candidatus Eisenbergiella merdipullorum]|uniref:GDSL family lipase n=1 Tax=Candidatus Eisenbergiella merdipullorum TaxID=2838553 RepID=A0A9D2I9T9_9FIRM|nr:GDSL family lipase [Candidatus Eisenbergiella merdipullorum]
MVHYLPTEPEILILGRTRKKNPLPLFWTASGLEFRTDGSELWFELESDYESMEEWIRIEVDGFCLQRLIVPKGRSRLCAFRGFPKGTRRTVRLLKEVQPMLDERRYLLVHGLECDGKLYPPLPKKCRIEFVGDSLSAGVGLAGAPSLVDAGAAVYGLDGNYALLTAEYFQADFRILAKCGWGAYCSCDNDLVHIMPKYYEQVCGVLTGEHNRELGAFEENDFSGWQPDLVVINLGSNDGFAVDRPAWTDPETGFSQRMVSCPYGGLEEQSALRFEAAVKDFLKKLRRLNPNACLLWAYGMCEHRMSPYLEAAVRDYRKESGDEKADFLLLPATNPLWVGSENHPGKKEHELAAKVLIERVKEYEI